MFVIICSPNLDAYLRLFVTLTMIALKYVRDRVLQSRDRGKYC